MTERESVTIAAALSCMALGCCLGWSSFRMATKAPVIEARIISCSEKNDETTLDAVILARDRFGRFSQTQQTETGDRRILITEKRKGFLIEKIIPSSCSERFVGDVVKAIGGPEKGTPRSEIVASAAASGFLGLSGIASILLLRGEKSRRRSDHAAAGALDPS